MIFTKAKAFGSVDVGVKNSLMLWFKAILEELYVR